ncbi:flagellar protein FlgN [Anaerosacchariphilus polymeriproducens]|uniref:Flagellar protein FlgN n=1 Tax=Anaerosacchariphilus polymeriproducens TaxID=1812858 RepID=A0A371AQQ2_9FIRM|nr:flagellar protein FlgN [Anaerosacchariphilus polymeriproducens]RDU21905.1 flagellar protein FlgN [Anaerosacchariphilus polymeriproducens]
MASLMEKLVEVLMNEQKVYDEILELSKDKTNVIVKGKIKELEKITEKEQLLANDVQKLEKEREKIMNDIGLVVKKDISELTISNIISMLTSQPKEQEKLKKIHDKLRETLNEMILINDRNKQLIEHSLEMIEFDMTLLKSMRQAPETANYNKSAYNTGDLLGNAGFDAKQ